MCSPLLRSPAPRSYLQVCTSTLVMQVLHCTWQHHTNLQWHRSTYRTTWRGKHAVMRHEPLNTGRLNTEIKVQAVTSVRVLVPHTLPDEMLPWRHHYLCVTTFV